MNIKLLSATVVAGQGYAAGSKVDAPDSEARFLIARGKAEPYTAPKKPTAKKKAPANKQVSTDDLETR